MDTYDHLIVFSKLAIALHCWVSLASLVITDWYVRAERKLSRLVKDTRTETVQQIAAGIKQRSFEIISELTV